jgi:hypothetical protein
VSKKTLKVRGGKNGPTLKEKHQRSVDPATGRDRNAIHDDDLVEVPNTRFYRRRVAAGDLVEVLEAPVAKPKAKE